jgi:hypothetical protein
VTNINTGSNINMTQSVFHQSQEDVTYCLQCALAANVRFGFLYIDKSNDTSETMYGGYTSMFTNMCCFCLKSRYV